MAGSAGTAGAETGAPPLSARVIGWHWRWPVLLASAAFVALLGAVVGVYSVLGEPPILEGDHGVLGIGSHARTLIVLSFVLAYTLGAGLFGLAKAPRELDRLRPILRLGDPKWHAFRGRLFPNARALSIAASIGAPVGAGLDLLPYLLRMESQGELSLHSLPFMTLLFAVLAMQALITIRQSQVFYEVGCQHLEVDLLDLGALSPFAAMGLANAAFWLIGSALASFLVTSDANVWIVAMVIPVTVGLGIVGLVLPSRGLHLRIRERKREELTRIREAVAGERAGLFSTDDGSPPAPRMPALLAYEARIESVREWPFDTSTLRRFALFLLIPLASWIGGALVERVVDAALG